MIDVTKKKPILWATTDFLRIPPTLQIWLPRTNVFIGFSNTIKIFIFVTNPLKATLPSNFFITLTILYLIERQKSNAVVTKYRFTHSKPFWTFHQSSMNVSPTQWWLFTGFVFSFQHYKSINNSILWYRKSLFIQNSNLAYHPVYLCSFLFLHSSLYKVSVMSWFQSWTMILEGLPKYPPLLFYHMISSQKFFYILEQMKSTGNQIWRMECPRSSRKIVLLSIRCLFCDIRHMLQK